MKLSVLDLVPVIGSATYETALAQAARLAITAEGLGFYRYWAAEHHDLEGLACTAPEVLLAHIGAMTRTIRLGTGALLLPHYKPIKVAETFRLLTALYGDRMDLGVGRAPGGSAHVSMALSDHFLHNVSRFPELLQDLLALLTDRFELDGQQVRAKPLAAAAPQVWLLGTNQKSAGYAARFGTGYVFGRFMSESSGVDGIEAYRQQFQPSGLLKKPQAIVAVGVICAPTELEAEQLAGQADRVQIAKGTEEAPAKMYTGTPEQIARRLRELQKIYGVEECMVYTPVKDYELRLRSYKLLAEVML